MFERKKVLSVQLAITFVYSNFRGIRFLLIDELKLVDNNFRLTLIGNSLLRNHTLIEDV